jgi:hypothetical protein
MRYVLYVLMVLMGAAHVGSADDALLCFADDLVGELDLDGGSLGVRDLTVHNGIAYLANRTDGLAIVDVSDAAHPVLLSTVQSFDFALDVTVNDGLAFVGTLGEGMLIVDVSDASAPIVVGHYDEPFDVYATVLQGDVAYLACHDKGIRVLDVSDPTAPNEIDRILTERFIIGLALANDRLVAPFWGEGIRLFDVSKPGDPVLLDTIEESDPYFDVAIDGDLVAVLNSHGRGELYDISSDTLDPYVTVEFPTMYGLMYDIDIESGHVFMANTTEGVMAYDVRDPNNVVHTFGYLFQREVYGLALSDGMLYVGGQVPSLSVFDVSGLQSPVIQTLTGFDRPPTLALSQGMMYAADPSTVQVNRVLSSGMLEFVTDFREPFSSGGIASVVADQDRLFIGNDTRADIAEYDISDPENPTLVRVSRIGNAVPRSMVRFGQYLVTGSGSTANVLDYTDGLNPVQVSAITVPNQVARLFVEGELLYIDLQFRGFMVYDLSDPSQPMLAADMSGTVSYTAMDVQGGVLYACTFQDGIDVYDCRDITDVQLVGHADFPSGASQIRAWGEYLYASSGSVKYGLFHLQDPLMPELVVLGGSLAYTFDVVLDGDYAYHSGNSYVTRDVIEVIRVFGCECPVDLNADGTLSFFDVAAFLSGYQAQDPLADWNGDGAWDYFDVSGFLMDYAAGCP